MQIFTFLITLVLITTACKKNNNEGNNPSSTNKCNGRYDKEYFSTIKTYSHIQYSRALNIAGVHEDLYMDVYEPENDIAKKRPLIIFVHGGGWVARGKDDGKEFCTLFAKKGYVAASINYRLGIENPINEKTRGEAVYRGVQDIKAAIRYARANATVFKIDTGQIFIGGYSAGAVNAVHAAYWNENEVPQNIDKQKWGSLEGSGGTTNFSSDVQAVYSVAGFIADLSCIQNGEPPMISVHSKTDNLIPYDRGLDVSGIYVYGATSIIQKATSVNVPVTLYTYDDISHGAYLEGEKITTTTNAINDFLYSKLKCQ